MKTVGMSQQIRALQKMNGRDFYALFMEQGTGKTWTILADAERLYGAGKIDAVLVIAPKGVHTNWVRREIPTHMDIPVIARAWRSGMGKRERAHFDELLKPREVGEAPPLRVLAMNIDAVNTNEGFAFAKRFLELTKALMAIDESSRIKNPAARRTKQIMRLQHLAVVRRIATGTPITKAPMDVFSQMEFLESGLLGTTSYRAFTAEYAEVMDSNAPMIKNLVKRNPNAAHAQIIKRNPDGSFAWRNLDKLQALLEPHSFRILKANCLDLPEKIYKQVYFDLSPGQRKAYELMEEEFRVQLEDGTILPMSELASLIKLQQITSGFVLVRSASPGNPVPENKAMYVSSDNPRLDALVDLMEDIPDKCIIWARFHEEISSISAALTKAGRKVVQYHGRVKDKDREIAVDSFQSGDADVFVGQAQSGGLGLTLTAAETVIYYSNSFDLEVRLQSEDRAHRIGTKKNVVYIDLVATDTIDEAITRSLQRKTNMAQAILGDRNLNVSRTVFSSEKLTVLQ